MSVILSLPTLFYISQSLLASLCQLALIISIIISLSPLLFLSLSRFLKMGHSQPIFFFIFVFSIQLTVNNCSRYILPRTGFKQRTSDVKSNHSTNWVTTTAENLNLVLPLCICLSFLSLFLSLPAQFLFSLYPLLVPVSFTLLSHW